MTIQNKTALVSKNSKNYVLCQASPSNCMQTKYVQKDVLSHELLPVCLYLRLHIVSDVRLVPRSLYLQTNIIKLTQLIAKLAETF